MGIEKIKIENYKSIKKCYLNLKQLNVLIGENGCGKTNVISAIKYFYNNLISENNDEEIFDKNNQFSNTVKIGIVYNCKELKKIIIKKMKAINANEDYYKKIYKLITKDKIYLELIKTKNLPIRWNIPLREDREIIYNIFPIYIIDTKNINSESWKFIWKQIGDLIKIENEVSKDFQNQITHIIKEGQDNKIAKGFVELEKVLKDSEIKIKKYTQREYATSIAKMYYSGENFEISEHSPSYFSEGTNSFNYINTFINIIYAIKNKKIKFPTIIIDEPEISLHHKYIDKISENLINKSKKIQFILSTHSSRLLKNILKEEGDNRKVFNLKYKNKYTQCTEMKLLDEQRQITFIQDEHVNCYFSNMIVLVEGESELELLNNKYLKIIYPILSDVDIIKAESNRVIENSLLPNKRNYKTSYLIEIDMDKVMSVDVKENKFKIKNRDGYFIYNEKENYYYGEKRVETYERRNRINKMIEKCRFHYSLPFYACRDTNFYDLKGNIKKYFLNYNIFVNDTTIEGMLINNNNYDKFWTFYKNVIMKDKDIQDLEKYYNSLKEYNKLNLLRLLVSGKTDYLLKLEQLDKIYETDKQLINKNKIGKTSGWITLWIEYYLVNLFKIDNSKDSDVSKNINTLILKNKDMCEYNFRNNFTELFNLIKEISKRFSN